MLETSMFGCSALGTLHMMVWLLVVLVDMNFRCDILREPPVEHPEVVDMGWCYSFAIPGTRYPSRCRT